MNIEELPKFLEYCQVFGITPTAPFAHRRYIDFKASGLTL